MDQEKFIQSYIELLTATITESIQKNLILQTQKKIAEQDLNEITIKLNEIEGKFKQDLTIKQNEITIKLNEIEGKFKQDLIIKQNEVDSLNHQLSEIKKEKDVFVAESGELKKNVEHISTFKNELIKARKHNENLVTKNDVLQVELEGSIKKIEKLETELAKQIKPLVETKNNKKNPFKIVDTVEDAGNF